MRKIALLVLSMFMLFSYLLFAQEPQGYIEYKENKKLVRVWGTHYERGYAQGYLLCDEITDVFCTYFVGYLFNNNAYLYGLTRANFEQNFVVDNKYITEGNGLLDGMVAGGQTLYNYVLERDIDVTDLMMCNSIVDFTDDKALFANNKLCSSITSWGTSTINAPELLGESIITRFLDWIPHKSLTDNHIILISFPSEPDEQNWISFTFPGLFGCLSAINENGVGSFYNVGNNNSYNPQDSFEPIFLSIRNGIEVVDYDSSGQCNPMDVVQAVSDDVQRSGSIMNVIAATEKDSFALVIECNNINGVAVRTKSDNTVITGDNLAVTNHFRKLYAPVYCYRYDNIVDSLDQSTFIDPNRSWSLLAGAAGISTNIQTIQYIPSTGEILWSARTGSVPAYQLAPTYFTTDELFEYVSADHPIPEQEGALLIKEIYPYPAKEFVNVSYYSKCAEYISSTVYDVKGRKTTQQRLQAHAGNNEFTLRFSDNMSSGIYFIRIDDNTFSTTTKMLVVR
ncbi:MAG: T9SS type A sorting domain-containing protein [Candidatus Celaenobacter antarcticus]|nr:T9SS type A sorting domain-containing protein [Candidatus Celaenobacter antarcticus]MDP8315198.1 T9SS type A sorting domain-containing protein [Candidatus Celaenobacter antarcticus]